MADKKSRLAEIYKAEKSKGGGIASTLGKRALEKMDPRKFFNQKGFLAAALPSLFKSYSATPEVSGRKISQTSSEVGQAKENKATSVSTGALETKLDILTGETRELKIHSKLAAKNSVVLPSMARDMNVTRQNIVKLVKLQGGTATTKADMFFKRASDREAGYESRFSKAGGVTTKTPTQVGAKPKEEKESGGILGFLGTIASYLLKGGLLGLLAIGVGKLLENQDVLEGVKSFVKQVILGIQKIIQKGSELLGDLFSDPEIKEGFIKTFVAVKDLFVKGINLLGDLASDPRFAAGVVEIFSAIGQAIKKAFISLDTYLKDELNVPGGLLTVLGVGGALYFAINRLGDALLALAGIALSSKLPGAPGVPAGAPGSPGKSNPKGGRGGWLKNIGTYAATAVGANLIGEGIAYYLEQGESVETARKKAQEDIDNQAKESLSPGEEIAPKKPEGMLGSEISRTTGEVVGKAALVYGGVKALSALTPSAPSTIPSTPTPAAAGKPLTSFGSVGANREMEKNKPLWEKISKVMKKAYDKGVSTEMLSKIRKKFGFFVFGKLAAVLGGVVAAPFSVGASLLISVFGAALLVSDLIDLYDWFIEYEKELDAYEKSLSPTPVAPIAPAVTAPVPYSASADSQAANTTKPTPTPTVPTSAPASNTPTANKTALDITASTEGGGRYDLAFGDKAQKDGTIVNVLGKSKNFPQLAGKIIMTPQDFSGKPLTEMTLAEVKAFQEYKNREAENTSALGKYGFMRATLFGNDGKSGLVGQLKLPMDTIFSPDTQELLQATMRKDNAAALEKQGVSATDANLNLANIVGAGGVAKLLKPENADKNALDVLGYARGGNVALTNPGLNKLSKDVVAETYSKYDASGMAPSSPSYGGTAVASAPPGPSYGGTAVASQSLPDFKMPSLGTLAAAAPSVGDMITSATSAFGDITRAFDTAMASVTNITNNNTQASAAAQQSQGNLPSVYDDVFLNLFQRVT
jgi:hypothetical protein